MTHRDPINRDQLAYAADVIRRKPYLPTKVAHEPSAASEEAAVQQQQQQQQPAAAPQGFAEIPAVRDMRMREEAAVAVANRRYEEAMTMRIREEAAETAPMMHSMQTGLISAAQTQPQTRLPAIASRETSMTSQEQPTQPPPPSHGQMQQQPVEIGQPIPSQTSAHAAQVAHNEHALAMRRRDGLATTQPLSHIGGPQGMQESRMAEQREPPTIRVQQHPVPQKQDLRAKEQLMARAEMEVEPRVATTSIPPERHGVSAGLPPYAAAHGQAKAEWDAKLSAQRREASQAMPLEAAAVRGSFPPEHAGKPPTEPVPQQGTQFVKGSMSVDSKDPVVQDAWSWRRGPSPSSWPAELPRGEETHAVQPPTSEPRPMSLLQPVATLPLQEQMPAPNAQQEVPQPQQVDRSPQALRNQGKHPQDLVRHSKPEMESEEMSAAEMCADHSAEVRPATQGHEKEASEPPVSGPEPDTKHMAQVDREKAMLAQNVSRQPPAGDAQDTPQRRQLKVEDALAYLEKVKIQFADQVNVYNQFLDIMKEFKAQSIDTTEVIRRVSNLFQGHKDLILGFNTFLPPGYKIKVTEDKTTGVLNAGFEGPEGFSELPPYRSVDSKPLPAKNGRMSLSGSSPKQKDAKSKATGKSQQMSPGQATGTQGADHMHKDIGSAQVLTSKGASAPFKSAPGNRRPVGKGPHGEDNGPHTPSVPHTNLKQIESSIPPNSEKAHEFERAIGFVNTIKERFSDDPATFDQFLNALSRFRDEQKGIREVFEAVAYLFGPHKDLLQQFKEFLPSIALGSLEKPMRSRPPTTATQRRPHSAKTVSQSTPTRKGPGGPGLARARRARDMQFFEDLKASLGPGKSDLYTEFIKCLSLFTQRIVTKAELQSLAGGILQEHPDANALFLQYLDSVCGSGDETMDEGNQASSSMSSEGAPAPVDAVRQARYLKKPVSEMGVEYGVEKDVSYRLLPPDFPAFEYGGRSTMEKRTLNDTWVSGTSGSEDYSFKFMRKNQNEDNLFRCEDDRYELDMVIATNASTIQKLETIVGTMSRLPMAEKKRHALAVGALSSINYGAIRRIYGEHGAEVITQLKLNPAQTVPVVIDRLRKKDSHWRQARHEMNRVWREVGERNYHKSLDHRSVHFKQVDKKELSTKNLLSDLFEPTQSVLARDAEMTRARGYSVPNGGGGANDRSLAIKRVAEAARRSSNLVPPRLDLCFEDFRIHEVVFEMVKGRIQDDGSSEAEANRIVDEFQKLIECFFDVKFSEDGCSRPERVSNEDGKRSMLLYGDECTYVMFRLYHLLFERVMEGLNLAREQITDREKREKFNRDGAQRVKGKSHIPLLATSPSSLTKAFPSAQDKDHAFSVGPKEGTAEEIFEVFLELARPFVRGKLDSAKFEEKSRTLLGAGSYCLFTLEKVVAKTAKQVMSAFTGDVAATPGTVSLFHRFRERIAESCEDGNAMSRADFEEVDDVYAAAAVAHITKARGSGANVIRFTSEYIDGDHGEFAIFAVGHTSDEVNQKGKGIEHTDIARFLRICSGQEEDKREKGSAGHEGESKRKGDAAQSRKRVRRSDSNFMRFAGSEEVLHKRTKTMQMTVCNGLVFKLDGKKRMRALDGTYDYLYNASRKRKMWSDLPDAQEANKRCAWARAVRRKMDLVKVAEATPMNQELGKVPEDKGSAPGQDAAATTTAKDQKPSTPVKTDEKCDVVDKDKMTDV